MRLLSQCSDCQRQYDATGWQVGSLFHCHCGSLVKVEQPVLHDAAVVRCSSCGAPRTGEGDSHCKFCESEFTLHEKDMETVCPSCLSRISAQAKFCHQCSTPILPEQAAGEESDLECPVCEDAVALHSRRIGQESATVLECGRCAGVWLGHEAFGVLTNRADREFEQKGSTIDWASMPGGEFDEDWRYRNCPKCPNQMVRRNFGKKSGFMIDVCGDHGVWFDQTELEGILGWIRAGGLAQSGASQARSFRRRGSDRIPDRSFVDEIGLELLGYW